LLEAHGFWPVLPFAGLEMLVLGWALRASLRNRDVVERLVIAGDEVRFDACGARDEVHRVFPRQWAKVKLRAPHSAKHPCRLLIESHGRACAIGGFLTDAERRGLASRLTQMIGR